jgi:hypothetical protein
MSGPGDDRLRQRRLRLGAAFLCAAALLFAMLAGVARLGREVPFGFELFTDRAIAVDDAFWGISLALIGLAFVLLPSKVPALGKVWTVIGGVAVVFGVAVAVRAAFPPRVTLTVTEREAGLADGGSGSDRGFVTDEQGRRWETSMNTYYTLHDGDRVVCEVRSFTWADADLSGSLVGCKSVHASE